MIRIRIHLTFGVLSVLALLILGGCGSSPDRTTAPAPNYSSTPIQAQPLQLSAGIAPAIARRDAGISVPVEQATPSPATAKDIEQEAPVDLAGIATEVESDIVEEPVVTEEPVGAEETTIAEQPVESEEPIINIVIDIEPTPDQIIETSSREDSHINESLDPAFVNTLILMTGPGKLTIEHDPGAENITISADVTVGGKTLGRAPTLSSGARIAIDRTAPGRPRIRVVDPKLNNAEDYEVDLTVRIPQMDNDRFALDIQDSKGDIYISGFTGELSITSLRGAIEVHDSSGSLVISSGRGPCEVRGFDGPVKVRDGGGNCSISEVTGDVQIWGRDGSLELRYISGVVTVIDARQGVTAQSIEGNLNLYAVPLARSVIEGVSGSVVSKTGAP
jgi:hypothetical protein